MDRHEELEEGGEAAAGDELLGVRRRGEERADEHEEAIALGALVRLPEEGGDVRDVGEGANLLVVRLVRDSHALQTEQPDVAAALPEQPIVELVEEVARRVDLESLGRAVEEQAQVDLADAQLRLERGVEHLEGARGSSGRLGETSRQEAPG